jgi:hypothetical protein
MSSDDWMHVFIQQILPRLKQFEDCWIFTGPTKNGTHGCVKVGGRTGKVLYTHRIAFEAFKGLLQPGELVMHQCNTPRCCNPYHLKNGNQSENMKYAYETGAVGRRAYEPGISGVKGVVSGVVSGYQYWRALGTNHEMILHTKDIWEAICARKSWESKQQVLPPFLSEG